MKVELLDIEVPTSWDEITLRQFKKIMKINEKDDLVDRIQDYIETILPLNKELISMLEINHYEMIWEKLNWIENIEIKPLKDKMFEIDGILYGLAQEDYLTLVEYIEASSYSNNNYIDNLEKVVVALLRPVKEKKKYKKYDLEPYDMKACNDRVDIMLDNCPADVAYTVLDFFLGTVKIYLKDIQRGLKTKTKEKKIKVPENINLAINSAITGYLKNTDGSVSFMTLQQLASLESLMMSWQEALSKYSTT